MAGGTWLINPQSGDYVMQGGAPVIDASLQTNAFFRVKSARTKWMYAPDDSWGSDVYLSKNKALQTSPTAIAAATNRALQPMVDDGRAVSSTTTVTKTVRGATALQANIIEASGQPTSLNLDPLGV